MSPLRLTYLVLAIIGAAWPIRYYAAWGYEYGASLSALISAWRANDATTALALDMLIASIALTIWIIAETRARKNWRALLAIPATFIVGLSFGLPLYLFLRTGKVK